MCANSWQSTIRVRAVSQASASEGSRICGRLMPHVASVSREWVSSKSTGRLMPKASERPRAWCIQSPADTRAA